MKLDEQRDDDANGQPLHGALLRTPAACRCAGALSVPKALRGVLSFRTGLARGQGRRERARPRTILAWTLSGEKESRTRCRPGLMRDHEVFRRSENPRE